MDLQAFLPLGVVAALVVITLVFERRYRGRKNAGGAQWQATGERFTDPTSGKLIEVRFNPATGERAYVEAAPTGANESAPK